MNRKLAIWDVDGTLVDSRASIYEAAKPVYACIGRPEPAYDDVRQIVGLSLREGLMTLLPDLDQTQADQAVASYKASFGARVSQSGYIEPLYEGAGELLDSLRRDGWLIAMATGKSRRGVDHIVRMHGWADLFDSTHCSDDGPGKPHPAMVLEALRVLDVKPQDAIMIGDTAHDMRMAKAAGVYAQGVSWGFHTADEVLAGGADHVADDFAMLNNQLRLFSHTL